MALLLVGASPGRITACNLHCHASDSTAPAEARKYT